MEYKTSIEQTCYTISKICSTLIGIIGVGVIIGWKYDIGFLKSVVPNFITMKPNAAACFIIISIVLNLNLYQFGNGIVKNVVTKGLSLFVSLVGVLTFLEYVYNVDLHIDQILFSEGVPSISNPHPNRMAHITSIIFMMMGIALLCMRSNRFILISQYLGAVVGLFGITVFVGYTYENNHVFILQDYMYAAFHAAINFVLFGVAILFANPSIGLARVITNDTAGGQMIRHLLPVAILVPIALGQIRTLGLKLGYYSAEAGTIYLLVTLIIASIVYIYLTGQKIAKIDILLAQEAGKTKALLSKLELVLESSEIGIWEWDLITNIASLDDRFRRIYGINKSEIEKYDDWKKCIYLEDVADVEADILKSIESKKPYDGQFRIVKPNGEIAYIQAKGILILDENSIPIRMMGTNWDITVSKRNEEKLNEAIINLKASNDNLQKFAYFASHDLQEPIRMMVNFSELLERKYHDKLDQDGKDFIQFIVDGGHRMQKMIAGLLEFSRVVTKGNPFTLTDSNQAVSQTLDNLSILIKERKATIIVDKLPNIKVDEIQLVQVFQNLIGNALKFCEKKPIIHIQATEKPTEWIFSVQDNGIGIAQSDTDRLFNIFQQLNPKDKYAGSGMGLAICKRIIERHNGTIWVQSELGKGSTFYFTFPKEPPISNLSS